MCEKQQNATNKLSMSIDREQMNKLWFIRAMGCYAAIKKMSVIYVDGLGRCSWCCYEKTTRLQSTFDDVFLSFFKGVNPTYVTICLCKPSEPLEGYIPGFNSGFLLWLWQEQSWKKNLFIFLWTAFVLIDLPQWACYSKNNHRKA